MLYFARKKDWRAVLGLAAGAAASVAASVMAFGWPLHRVYLSQVLPWALRGEAMDPYNLASSSLSSILHKLLVFEPQWNPHPAVHSPVTFAVLHPVLQMAILAPAILLINPRFRRPRQLQLEWSAVLVALLAISTLPASYHFTLLILPVTVMGAAFLADGDRPSLTLLAILYLAICFPAWNHGMEDGWWSLLAVPRLYFMLLFCLLCYATLHRQTGRDFNWRGERWIWAGALSVALLLSIGASLRQRRGIYDHYGSRIRMSPQVLLATEPVAVGNEVGFIGMAADGYLAGIVGRPMGPVASQAPDQLSVGAGGGTIWTEEAEAVSHIVAIPQSGKAAVPGVSDAEYPVMSRDGKWLAYLRSTKGRSRLWLRSLLPDAEADRPVTPPELDVEEMTFVPGGLLIVAASAEGAPSALFLTDGGGHARLFDGAETRYPAASPDGRRLAYSQLDHGVWNLWLRDLHDGTTHRLTNANCNDLAPAWESDSETLIYASDCGRALWFTALNRRKVAP